MKIDILGEGGFSVLNMLDSFERLYDEIDDTLDSFKGVKNSLCNICGGVDNLDESLACLNRRISSETEKRLKVENFSRRTASFISHTVETDKSVAAMVSLNQERFFESHSWLRPVNVSDKSWWQQRVEDWNDVWSDVGDTIGKAISGIVEFVKEHKQIVEIVIGAIAIIAGAAILALTGGTAAVFVPALIAGLKVAAFSAVIRGAVGSLIAAFTGGNVLQAFGDGLASGFMWGGLAFFGSSLFTAFKVGPAAHKWGINGERSNQGYVHYFKKPDTRIREIEKMMGLKEGTFTNRLFGTKWMDGFNQFTEQAEYVISNGISGKGVNGQICYYLAYNARKGFAVITYNGKIQSMMVGQLRWFLRNFH